ncbi:MAG: ArsR family transcriptional regulator [Candidatus Muiribacterium halophilum]|uniref:ArsR family transcriptional regulator n=1 Tax=Muiribacterium halophilum TaxID=2053465 RepID=A0A2N5Z980_MUIH1|nr:MAG: ArsR family transcriptional regulator [Candidatus Muirbacterium halophilum]
MRRVAETAKSVAHPTRIMILNELLSMDKCCVSKIEEILKKKQANISQHLSILKNAGLIDYEENGKLRCYYVKDRKTVKSLLNNLEKLTRR